MSIPTTGPDLPDAGHDLLNAALIGRMAQRLGAPRLALRAAREARAHADRLAIELSPAIAFTPPGIEADRLADVKTTGDLCALLAPAVEEEP